MSLYDRDLQNLTPPAFSTRSRQKQKFYKLYDDDHENFIKAQKKREKERKELARQTLRWKQSRQNQQQRFRQISDFSDTEPPFLDMAQADAGGAAAPPTFQAGEMAFIPKPFLGKTHEDAQSVISY